MQTVKAWQVLQDVCKGRRGGIGISDHRQGRCRCREVFESRLTVLGDAPADAQGAGAERFALAGVFPDPRGR